MNRRNFRKSASPQLCAVAIESLQDAAAQGAWDGLKGKRARQLDQQVVAAPEEFLADPSGVGWPRSCWRTKNMLRRNRSAYRTWGTDIDDGAHAQMRDACRVPNAVGAALMPDAHIGYGLPIGGVLACEGAVIPYAVGVDIACRMKLSVLDLPVERWTSARRVSQRSATGHAIWRRL